ncbi:OsmC family protein [Pseudomonas sp. UBA4194]|jgi:putative redox protein|uniref:OsmC family protein n=1 Tax=Pseudomonas sp. UBA4194 TaxID=1947317 RepID=UPI0025F9F5D5|nr:OsmC family protein [Pseudomonas sp. UBA4194]
MTITVKTESSEGFRHSIDFDGRHTLVADLPESLGGSDSAPSPHDYFDAALGACKALTLKLYAQKKHIPLTGVEVEVRRDNSQEPTGKYSLNVKLTLHGNLTEAQRHDLDRVADHCPVHKLMTTAEIEIETYLAE